MASDHRSILTRPIKAIRSPEDVMALEVPGLISPRRAFHHAGMSIMYASETPHIETSEVTSAEDLAGLLSFLQFQLFFCSRSPISLSTQFPIILRITEHIPCL